MASGEDASKGLSQRKKVRGERVREREVASEGSAGVSTVCLSVCHTAT